jgi:hypothetical protein
MKKKLYQENVKNNKNLLANNYHKWNVKSVQFEAPAGVWSAR